MNISLSLARKVRERAGERCEYCGLAQEGQEALFHLDHVMPVAAGGGTTLENLALACVSCSLRKGARQGAFDPETQNQVSMFNPRIDQWHDHFRWKEIEVVGLTPVGRATILALKLNRELILSIREEEKARGRHPPT